MKKDKRRITLDLRDPVQVELLEACTKARDAFRPEAELLDAPQIAMLQAAETIKHQKIQAEVNERQRELEVARARRLPGQYDVARGTHGGLAIPMVRRRPRRRRPIIELAPDDAAFDAVFGMPVMEQVIHEPIVTHALTDRDPNTT